MNKWFFRLVGLLIVVVLSLLFLRGWLYPKIPEPIARELAGTTIAAQASAPPPPTTPEPPLTLTSLEPKATPTNTIAPVPSAPKATTPPPTNKPATPLPQTPAPVAGNVWLQAGSFSEPDNAQKRLNVFRSKGWRGIIDRATVSGKVYYRVYLGPLQRVEVPTYLKQLRALNISARETNR